MERGAHHTSAAVHREVRAGACGVYVLDKDEVAEYVQSDHAPMCNGAQLGNLGTGRGADWWGVLMLGRRACLKYNHPRTLAVLSAVAHAAAQAASAASTNSSSQKRQQQEIYWQWQRHGDGSGGSGSRNSGGVCAAD